jgi:hypothetical protein
MSASEVRQALRELEDLRYAAGNLDEALRRIVEATHQLFAVDGAGLMLIDPDQLLRNVAVSDQRVHDLAWIHRSVVNSMGSPQASVPSEAG